MLRYQARRQVAIGGYSRGQIHVLEILLLAYAQVSDFGIQLGAVEKFSLPCYTNFDGEQPFPLQDGSIVTSSAAATHARSRGLGLRRRAKHSRSLLAPQETE